jgi:ADP-ribosylglycohydrolase
MFGALVGDCIGSFWEPSLNKDPGIPLWIPACHFTDDSVCTGAVAAWLLEDPEASVDGLTQRLHDRGRQHLDCGFAERMRAWVESDAPEPYGSWGNGAIMRVSPIALFAQSDEEALALAERSTAPTHNCPESVQAAQAIVWAIRQAFQHRDPVRLVAEVSERFGYPGMTTLNMDQERHEHVFDVTAQGTAPLAVVIAAQAGSFRAAMNTCCSLGGDADTLAATAGPIAEALYGVPEVDVAEARRRFSPDDGLWEPVAALYAHPQVQANLLAWNRAEGTQRAGFERTLSKGLRSRPRAGGPLFGP